MKDHESRPAAGSYIWLVLLLLTIVILAAARCTQIHQLATK